MTAIGFIGAGKIAQALCRGFIASGICKADQMLASCPKEDVLSKEQMKEIGCKTTNLNADVIESSDVVLLSIKPFIIPMVLKEIANIITDKNLIISVALGVPLSLMQKLVPDNSRVVRVMTNTPAVVRAAATAFALGQHVREKDRDVIFKLFNSVGICEEVPESYIDAVTALSGSGPGYCYMAMEALADGAVRQGLPRNLAIKLAAQTLLGSAQMLMSSNSHPGTLKDEACSPAGSTIEGVYQLEKCGFRSALIEAVEVAHKKCVLAGRDLEKQWE